MLYDLHYTYIVESKTMNIMKKYIWTSINTLGLLAVLYVNYLANAMPIGGYTTGELSAFYPNLFVPAGVTFSIWGIIYLFLIFFVGYQWYAAYTNKKEAIQTIEKIGPLFLVSCLANMGWIYTWHLQMVGYSIVMMLLLLGSLTTVYGRVTSLVQTFNRSDKVMLLIPFSLYTSWITVALVANVTAALVHIDWDGFGLSDVFWANTMISIAFLLSVAFVYNYGDIFFGGVTIWALLGIIVKRSSMATPDTGSIVVMAWVGIAAVAAVVAYVMYKKRLFNKNRPGNIQLS